MKIILIAAQSIDGFIARHDEPGSGFASEADQIHFQAAVSACDACVMGATTYAVARRAIRARLTAGQRRLVLTRDPAKYAAESVPGSLEFTDRAPEALVRSLRAEGRRRCALLGGAQIHSLFLAARLVDELWLTVEPRLFGGGVPLLRDRTDLRLRLLSQERLGGTEALLLKYGFAFSAKG